MDKRILLGFALFVTAGVSFAYIPIVYDLLNPKDTSDQFYNNDYRNTKNNISNADLNTGVPLLDNWFETIKQNGNIDGKANTNDYTKKVYYSDNTPALLGYYFGYYSRNKTNSHYKDDLKNIKDNVLSGSVVDYNSSLDTNKNLQAMYTLYVSGQSYGYIYGPDPSKQSQLQRNPALYSFRVGQQQIRDAVVKEYTERILLLNKELENLYSEYKRNCDIGQNHINNFQSDWAKVSAAPDFIVGLCSGTLFYMNILNQLEDITRANQDMIKRYMQISCTNLLTNITSLKTQIYQTQLQLATLSANYGILSNMEKDRLK